MKAQVINDQLLNELPLYTSLFHDTLAIASMSIDTLEVTVVTTTDHGLITGDIAHIQGVKEKNLLSSLTSSNGVATGITTIRTDLSQDFQSRIGDGTINITGADQSEYNGNVSIIDVVDNFTFTYEIEGTPAPTATGTIFLNELKSFSYNGLFQITRIDDTTFTYTVQKELLEPDISSGIIHISPRIFVTVNITKVLEEYTEKAVDKFALFIVLGETRANRNRANINDASDSIQTGDDFRQQLIGTFTCYIIAPTTKEIGAELTRDIMEDVRFFLFNTLLRKPLQTGTSAGNSGKLKDGITYISDDIENYVNAYYVHRFDFETVYEITTDDAIKIPDSSALLNIKAQYLNSFNVIIKEDIIIGEFP